MGRRDSDNMRQILMDVTQALLAIAFGGATLWLFVSTGNAPEGLIGLAGPIVTFYFRERRNGYPSVTATPAGVTMEPRPGTG